MLTGSFTVAGLLLVVNGSGFPPGAQVQLLWDDRVFGTEDVASDGTIMDDAVLLPALLQGSPHTLKAKIGTDVVASTQVTVPN